MTSKQITEFSEKLHLPFTNITYISRNPYCTIYRGILPSRTVIIKKYNTETPELAHAEARGINTYHRLVKNTSDFTDAHTIRFKPADNLICMSFVPGIPLNSLLYSCVKNATQRDSVFGLITAAGRLLSIAHEKTQQPDAPTDAFIFEYIRYCTQKLASLPLIGSRIFADFPHNAATLCEQFPLSDTIPSFCHGDFVGKNILVASARIGCIDFTNARRYGHILNDYFAFLRNIDALYLPDSFRTQLRDTFMNAIPTAEFPIELHRFYYEYHRFRWLMLQFCSHSPVRWLRAVKALQTTAKPFESSFYAIHRT